MSGANFRSIGLRRVFAAANSLLLLAIAVPSAAQDVKTTAVYARLKTHIDAVRAIDTHDHLLPFDKYKPFDAFLMGSAEAESSASRGECALRRVWQASYYSWTHPLEAWPKDGSFDRWWAKAKGDFVNSRAATFYRYMLPAFTDLYGVDFETITDAEARQLNDRIAKNYQSPQWIHDVVTRRANIELMLIDPLGVGLEVRTHYPFAVAVCNINTLVRGFHPSEADALRKESASSGALVDPFTLARNHNLQLSSLDDYEKLLDRVVVEAKKADAVCLKCTLAYARSLRFENVPKQRAARAFGRPRKDLSLDELRDFEDFVIWRLVELCGQHDLPIQIHTGHARIQGSNPMLLVDMIDANPKTKFILFHGGFPWVSESGLIAMKYKNVWLDSCWMPTLSYTIARRGYQEWLDMAPSNKILWGSDGVTAEGIYGATVLTRQCLAEALAEKVIRGELREADAHRIGRQVMRDNALELFPSLRKRVAKQ